MEHIPIEILSETSNYGVVRMPDRAFPGSVIQGDSLSVLCRLAASVRRRASLTNDADLLDEASELQELLEDRLRHYEKVLGEHGINLPYNKLN